MSDAQEARVIDFVMTNGRKGEPNDPPPAPRRGSTTAQIEEIFYENFLRYFKNAEEKRRWHIEKDIPWDKASSNGSELTAQIVESFSAVEMYLAGLHAQNYGARSPVARTVLFSSQLGL